MKAERLIELFERVGEAPGAVERLRKLVLELAMRGSLSPEGESAKWSQLRLSDCATVFNGRAYKKQELLSAGTPVVRIQNLNGGNAWYYSTLVLEDAKYCQSGDLLFAWSGTFGPYIWQGPRSIYHYHIWKIVPRSNSDTRFLFHLLRHLTEAIKAEAHGLMLPHMTKERMENWPVLLPPMAEQQRIVTRVDELMALCDQLESAQAERERRRDRLVTASLQRLREPVEDGAVFREQAAFHLRHMGRMTTRVEHVREMREAVLAMAVRGMLSTRQNQCTATELLQRVAVQMEAAERQEIIKRRETLAPVSDEESPYQLPASWSWARFQDVAAIQSNLVNPREFMSLPLIAPDNIESSTGRLLAYGSTEEADVRSGKHHFSPGVLLYSKIRPALNKVVSVDFEGLCSADMYPVLPFINRRYLQIFMLSDAFLRQSVAQANRVAMPKINQEALNHIAVAVPPMDEQEYIVERVDRLLAYCDELAMALVELAQHRVTLLDAAISQALVATSLQSTDEKTWMAATRGCGTQANKS